MSGPIVGVGISLGFQGKGYAVALRLGDAALEHSKPVRDFIEEARGEVDIRVVGRVYALKVPWNREHVRPLEPGISIGHFNITAGTLGCFVRMKSGGDERLRILSNNHVLANVNRARRGDPILQRGPADGGMRSQDTVAVLETYKRILFTGSNEVDAALATLVEEIDIVPGQLRGIGGIAGVAAAGQLYEEKLKVKKLGRTTGITEGEITAVEVVVPNGVAFGEGKVAPYHHQIEIQSTNNLPFSRGGDSGSLVVTSDGTEAVGLLFAGTDFGGHGGLGLTYANPIQTVLDGLRIDLVTR
ncbi:hypothetical protein [Roseimicrobium gellanilyticum]|uniref:hypothetical protein n=1 Tax=Roseimicrobium gellanilyticum TaxID=748857 RepID=UPI001B868F67|nr:hypothetical protein [Roseimicrobium gellanilyticum]